MKKNKLAQILLFVLATLSLITSMMPKAWAQSSGSVTLTWVDYDHVNLQHSFAGSGTINGVKYSNFDKQDGVYTLAEIDSGKRILAYTLGGGHSGECVPEVRVDTDNLLPSAIHEVNLKPTDNSSNGSACTNLRVDGSRVQNNDFANARILFNWVNVETLEPIPAPSLLPYGYSNNYALQKYGSAFRFDSGLNYFKEDSGRRCPSYIDSVGAGKDSARFVVGDFDASGDCSNDFDIKYNIKLGKVSNAALTKDQGQLTNPTDTTAGQAPKIDCNISINPLTWLVCPIVSLASDIVGKLDNAINTELFINTNEFLNENCSPNSPASPDCPTNSSGQEFFTAWSVVRYISMSLLVLIALIMVISQALSIGIFDAYSIRKIVPRLVLAVIFISLSWSILKLAVNLTNDVGVGIRELIYWPFRGSLTDTFGPSAGSEAVVSFGAVNLGIIGLGLFGLLSLGLTAALAVATAFAVLIVRKIAILLLIVLAPLGIVMSILPGTQRAWRAWHENFSRALLIYPIISAFIAFGRVFAAVTNNAGTGGAGLLSQFIIFIAYFGPYFALPFAIRLAGGAIATLGGIANDRTRGVFDRLKKGRQELRADRTTRAKSNQLWNPNNPLLQRMARSNRKWVKGLNPNNLASWSTAPVKNLQYAARGTTRLPFLGAAGRQLESSINAASMEQSGKVAQYWNTNGANDKFYRAVGGMYDGFSNEAGEKGNNVQRELIRQGFATGTIDDKGVVHGIKAVRSLRSEKDFRSMADILAKSTSDGEQKAGLALRNNAAYTAGLYKDKDMLYANTAIAGALGLAQHQFFDSNDSAAVGNLITKETGNMDFAHAAVSQAELIGSKGHPENKPGYGHAVVNVVDPSTGRVTGRKFVAGTSAEGNRAWQVFGTFAQGDWAQAKADFYNDNKMGQIIKQSIRAADPNQATAVSNEWRDELRTAGFAEPEIDNEIDRRLRTSTAKAQATKDELFSIAGRYSGAPLDSKINAKQIIDQLGLTQEFDRFNYSYVPGEAREGFRPPTEPPPPPGQQPPGPTPPGFIPPLGPQR